ncbi:MAG: PEP-CTERM sorting domain-containing protein [bacterium]|nr:PEP-CTERM sorting domain-containing protein [bacterium]
MGTRITIAVVPEPTTFVLLAVSLGGFAVIRRIPGVVQSC